MTVMEAKKRLAVLLEYHEEAAGVTVPLPSQTVRMKAFSGAEGLGMFALGYAIDCVFSSFVCETGKSEESIIAGDDWQGLAGATRKFFDNAKTAATIPAVIEEMEQEKAVFLRAIERLRSEE